MMIGCKESKGVKAQDAFKDTKFICLLFAGYWSPPCRTFMQTYLRPFYTDINDDGKKMEVVYITMREDVE